jgi:uncharacterized protein
MMSLLLTASLLGAVPSDDVVASTKAWQERRLSKLQAEDGWLTLAGLSWLKEGANTAGSDPKADVTFPDGAPALVGTLTRSATEVTFAPAKGVTATLKGQPFTGGPLKNDAKGALPDIVQVDRFTFQVIVRGEKLGVRIKDPQARARTAFHGIPTWEPNAKWQLRAKWEATPGATLPVPNVLGQIEQMPSPGSAVFTVEGKTYRLTPVLEDGSPRLFFVFGDETNKTESYGAGRFLYADPPIGDVVLLDFNQAYNPPCAFSAYATCPLPPKGNRLPFRVDAGEKRTGSH